MPGRPLLDNDNRIKSVSTYMPEEKIKMLDKYIKDNHCGSRAWFIRRLILAKMENEIFELPSIANFSAKDVQKLFTTFCSLLQNEERKQMLFQILQDEKKTDFLFSMIQDSKFLTGR